MNKRIFLVWILFVLLAAGIYAADSDTLGTGAEEKKWGT